MRRELNPDASLAQPRSDARVHRGMQEVFEQRLCRGWVRLVSVGILGQRDGATQIRHRAAKRLEALAHTRLAQRRQPRAGQDRPGGGGPVAAARLGQLTGARHELLTCEQVQREGGRRAPEAQVGSQVQLWHACRLIAGECGVRPERQTREQRRRRLRLDQHRRHAEEP